MDIFDEEIIKFWKSLHNNAVRYIMVGGYATNLHGYQRFTGDMDIWIEDTVEECLQMASLADIDGTKVPILHINHLIANKKAVNRSKDQLDVIQLEKIRKLREG